MSWLQVSIVASAENFRQVEDTLIEFGAKSFTLK